MFSLSWTMVIGSAIALVTIFLIYHTFDEAYAVSIITAGRGPVFFPRIVLAVMLVLSLAVMYEARNEKSLAIPKQAIITVLATFALIAVYILSITIIGFLISTVVITFIMPWLLGYRKFGVIAAISVIYPVTVWFLFNRVFKIILPGSPWFDSF